MVNKLIKYFAMKKLLMFLTILAMVVMSSCSNYDDSEIRQKIDALEERVTSIETLLKASANKLNIVSIEETEDGTVITFSDNSKVTINNNGVNSPIVDVEVDGDWVHITLEDGTVLTFKKYEINENCIIYYTTTDGKKIEWDEGNNTLVSHIYENGQGALIFERPVTYVGCSGSKTLKSIVIPETVEEVGTFYNSSNLEALYCKAINPPIAPPEKDGNYYPSVKYGFLHKYDENIYGRYSEIGCIIYVPKESVEAYKNAEWWSRYASDIKGYDFE